MSGAVVLYLEVNKMKSFLMGIAVIFGDFLLCGFLHRELQFSFEKCVLIFFFGPFALALALGVLSFLLQLILAILDSVSKSNDIKSFIVNLLSSNVILTILGVAIIIGSLWLGLWIVAKLIKLFPEYVFFAFVAFVIYACIVGPPPPPPPPPKGTGVQRMWIGIHQDQLEALEREREELLEEIDDLRRDRDCIDT